MKITALTVSVNCSDKLAWAASNRHLFHRWVVVTTPEDEETRCICSHHQMECLITNCFYDEGAKFNKYKGLNYGLHYILKSEDEWILIIDADIILPPVTKRVFNYLILSKYNIYGIDRADCIGLSNLAMFMKNPQMIIDNWKVTSGDFKLSARISQFYGNGGYNCNKHPDFVGWIPLGFFQLFHREALIDERVPDSSGTANHCDVEFALQFPRTNRVLIPEIIGVHLESDKENWGKDWNGRTTPDFNAM